MKLLFNESFQVFSPLAQLSHCHVLKFMILESFAKDLKYAPLEPPSSDICDDGAPS